MNANSPNEMLFTSLGKMPAFTGFDQPDDAQLLAPLVRDEILIRLLRSPMGPRVAEIGRAGSSVQRIANAVTWLRANFDRTANIEELATLMNMSVTSFHRQFRAVTGMSPLQYQKTLRLQEARRLMLTTMIDAGAAGRRVGYVSASQVSRAYSRFFGHAPAKGMHRLRSEAPSPAKVLANVERGAAELFAEIVNERGRNH